MNKTSDAELFVGLLLFGLAALVFYIVTSWKFFEKAGRPGWVGIIPFYNVWALAEVASKPGWWGLIGFLDISDNSTNHKISGFSPILSVIGLISFVFYVLISLGIAKNFNKSTAFAILLILLPFIGYPILAFGDAKYKPIAAHKVLSQKKS